MSTSASSAPTRLAPPDLGPAPADDEATYMMNSLLEGDLYDDELNGMSLASCNELMLI